MDHVIYDALSLDQFLRLPEAKPALEYIDGKVTQKMAAKRAHSALQNDLAAEIRAFARPRHLGRGYTELRCTFDGRSLVPDLVFFARGRIPKDEDGRQVDDVFLPPDLMVEILSPGQTVKNLSIRLNWCVRHGVRLGWLIQPRRRRAYIFRADRSILTLELGQDLDGEDVLPGFRLPLATLFGWLDED
jgi:Uma2 family endonuclease